MCHPERSEGSQVFGKARFFAALRKTISVFFDFFNSLLNVDVVQNEKAAERFFAEATGKLS